MSRMRCNWFSSCGAFFVAIGFLERTSLTGVQVDHAEESVSVVNFPVLFL
jgi:hypothetical protein